MGQRIFIWTGERCAALTEAEMDLETGAPAYIVRVGLNLHLPAGGFPNWTASLPLSLPDAAPRPGLRLALTPLAEPLGRAQSERRARRRAGRLPAAVHPHRPDRSDHSAAGTRLTAEAVGIDDDFRLLLRLPDGGQRAIHCGGHPAPAAASEPQKQKGQTMTLNPKSSDQPCPRRRQHWH